MLVYVGQNCREVKKTNSMDHQDFTHEPRIRNIRTNRPSLDQIQRLLFTNFLQKNN
jgi:arsenate reductase-like glutaredoxin family protein